MNRRSEQHGEGERRAEVVIIGGGPVGLEVAWALKREGIDYLQLEAGQIGATMRWWAPGTHFFSSPERIQIAGVPLVTRDQEKASREDYLAYLRQVALAHELHVETGVHVKNAARDGDGFVLETEPSLHGVGEHAETPSPQSPPRGRGSKASIRSGKLVLAIGNMHRPSRLGIPGEDLLFVSHYLDDPHEYFRQRVLIVGGKNSAVEAAIRLHRVGADVTMSYRQREFSKRVKYWLRPELNWLIDKGRIAFLPETTPSVIEADGTVHIEQAPSQTFDRVLLLTGYEQDESLFEQLGVELEGDDRTPVLDESTMETNAGGVFVAGTACGGTPASGVKVFIETSHLHGERIAAAITGRAAPVVKPGEEVSLPES